MDYLFQIETTFYKELLLVFCFCVAYIAVLFFIISVVDHTPEPFFYYTSLLLIGFNVLVMATSPFMHLHITLMLFASGVLVGALLGVIHVVMLYRKHDMRGQHLLIMMLLFAPSSSLLLLSRFGIIDDSLLSEHLILLIIIGEMIVMSFLMFNQIHKMRVLFELSQYADPRNKLPNILALKAKLGEVIKRQQTHALTYCWFSGLERMEIAHGSDFRDQYLQQLALWLDTQLKQQGFGLNIQHKCSKINVFYCEKNTLAFITYPLNHLEHARLQSLLTQTIDLMRVQYSYGLDMLPIIASTNATKHDQDMTQLMQNTTVALAQCLQSGQSLLLYNDDVGYNERRKITLLHDFEQSLAKKEFYLEWQPQLDSHNQQLSGLEALVRWKHPLYGEISPALFIPLLEQSAQISHLSRWVITQVFAVVPEFLAQYPALDISVNLSVHDLMGRELLPVIDQLLENSPQVITQHLIFEVTESMHMEDNQRVLTAVEALQQRGFRISIDDFGAGYASFGYLQTLPVNELKIDRRYTETCHEPNSQAIIRSIIDLAKRLNMTIVVEGIENQRQQELFTDWGAHRLQGWKLGKPCTQSEILTLFH